MRIRPFILALCGLLLSVSAQAQTGTAKSKSVLSAEIATCFPNQTTGAITPLTMQSCMQDFLASWMPQGQVRAVTLTTDTILASDDGFLVTYNNASPVAVTLPSASTWIPNGNFAFLVTNRGVGAVTITPSGTINGSSSLTVLQNNSAYIFSDGSDYQAITVVSSNSTPYGVATMWPSVGQSTTSTVPWNVIGPQGQAISCANTTTQCLQEFMNAAAANGWPAEVNCQGTQFPSALEPIVIEATSSVTVPVAQDWSFHSRGCNLNFNVTTVSGLIIDSEGASVFDWDGKIVYNVTSPNGNVTTNPSCVVYINPQTNTADGFAGEYGGLIRIKSPVANPVSGTTTGVICINTGTGSVIQQTLDFQEINANNASFHGIMIFGASGSTGFMQSHVYANQIHGATLHGLDLGHSSSNQSNYNSNQWVINNIENEGATSRGIDTFGSYDTFDIGVINNGQGGLQYGIVTESSATANQFRYGQISGASTAAINDTGTCTTYTGAQGSQFAAYGSTSGCSKIQSAATPSNTLTVPTGTGTFAVSASAPLSLSTTTGALSMSVGNLTNSIAGNVSLNNVSNFFDGPTVAQGTSGTWFASGKVTLGSTNIDTISCKLWDGTTVIDSGVTTIYVASKDTTMALSGVLASPAANIKISCQDVTNTTGSIIANGSGASHDSTVTVYRLQ